MRELCPEPPDVLNTPKVGWHWGAREYRAKRNNAKKASDQKLSLCHLVNPDRPTGGE